MNAQHPLAANYQARYRAESARPAVSLIRKRCSCGAAVTAKQISQYGACTKCAKSKADTSGELVSASITNR